MVWLGHSAIRITGEKTIYIDPFRIAPGVPADIILITHGHYDHLDTGDIDKVRRPHTVIVAPVGARQKISDPVRTVRPGDQIVIDTITIKAVPAYNINKNFHPREHQNVGYIINTNNLTYYHAGDSDHIPEMKTFHADVAFLPVSGIFTMDAAEAALAAKDIRPQVAVPIHWGTVCGSRGDAEKFKQLAECEVQILNKGK